MVLTRAVDECIWRIYQQETNYYVPTCRGYEAAQVGTSLCIEVGKDFTLPYYRDLGVVLTIGMTPYEVLRTYILAAVRQRNQQKNTEQQGNFSANLMQPLPHWGYHKHNLVAGSAPVSTQILHAAGIAFACKLRKGSAVTIAYCGDGATGEPDFLEGITFAAQHQLPAVFICEQDDTASYLPELPAGLQYRSIDGSDVVTVYLATQAALQHAREGLGPVLLALKVRPQSPGGQLSDEQNQDDPLIRCQRYLEKWSEWDNEWAAQLRERLHNDVEQTLQDALQSLP
jgi:2-oxoisovalerate dehydrogenase E1 component alpha subunit